MSQDAAGVTTAGPHDPRHGASSAPQRGRGRVDKLHLLEAAALPIATVLVFCFFSLWPKTSEHFLTVVNLSNIVSQQAIVGILALAILVPLTAGQFDFAVGPIAGLAQMLTAGLLVREGMPVLVAIGVALLVGLLVGVISGDAIARIGVNSLIVTLGLSTLLAGVVEWYSGGLAIVGTTLDRLAFFGTHEVLGVPAPAIILLVLAIGMHLLLERTVYGRRLQAIGANRDAARLVGIPVTRYVLFAYVISGALAALAGVVMVARNGAANPGMGGVTDSLQALTAAFLGATAIRPGRFNVLGTLFAIYLLAFSVTGLSMAGVQGWVNNMFNGVALFSAVIISTVLAKRRVGR